MKSAAVRRIVGSGIYWIHFVILSDAERASIPGGHIGSAGEQRMPDGEF